MAARYTCRTNKPAKTSTARKAQRGAAASNFLPLVRAAAPVPSEVYETYWQFAHARQEVFYGRIEGRPAPWTSDPTIRDHRFTNAYRASDRVSQYLIRHVIHGQRRSAEDMLFRILIFKFFNRIDTWELLERELGDVSWDSYTHAEYDRVLTHAIDRGERIYSAAYIMPPCRAFGAGRKHRGHLRLIEQMLRDGVASRLVSARKMADVFTLLRSYPMLGPFLAYQYAVDINYSELTDFSESEFVMPGPGARDGLRKMFADPGGYGDADLIRWVADRQEQEFCRLGLPFRTLWGRRLQLIDCQNLFCEVDKYARVRHPSVIGISGRTRIKQKYSQNGPLPQPWYPPKWGLNEQIEASIPISDPQRPEPLDSLEACV